MSKKISLDQYDTWLTDGSEVAALVMRQCLEPVEGKDAVIFPPTYAKPERMREEDWSGYNIDEFDDGSNVCQIDSVGAQANRMEPLFKREPYCRLVPQVIIKAGDKQVNLLDVGHRAGDAIARFASTMEGDKGKHAKTLAEQIWDAFKGWQDRGDAELLARIAPTSLVFGAWDSRATQAKLPRIVRSVIRAYDVNPCKRSAQFNTPLHYVDEGLLDESLDKGEGDKNPLSQEGFRHSPAAGAHGGVVVKGDIRRDVCLNLTALRALGAQGDEDGQKRKLALRRYILGLALVSLTQRNDEQFNLREGCLLRIAKSSPWEAVPFEGEKKQASITPPTALEFAEAAAVQFKVRTFERSFVFDGKNATKWLKLKKDDRDKRRRNGPVIKQRLAK